MLRLLTLFTAICILLLIGYVTMEQRSPSRAHEVLDEVKEVLSENVGDGSDIKPKISGAIKKSKDIVSSVLEDAKSVLDEVAEQTGNEKDEQTKVEIETIEEPFAEMPVIDEVYEQEPGEKWTKLNETHRVLSDVSEMLK